MARSIGGPSPIPQTVFALSHVSRALRAVRPVDRPITLVREPSLRKPTTVGFQPPKPGDPYSEVGLDTQEDLANQVRERIVRSMKTLQDSVTNEVRKNAGRALSQKRKGTVLKDAILSGAGTGEVLKAEVRLSDRERGDMSYIEQRRIIKLIRSVLSKRMATKMATRKFPRVIESKKKLRPVGVWDGEILILPRSGGKRADSVILGTVTRYLDTFGKNGRAAVIARNGSCIGEEVIRQGDDVFIPIRGSDWRTGRVHGNTDKVSAVGPWDVRGGAPTESDWSSFGNSMLTDGQEDRLALLWDMNPDHVGFVSAYVEGQFV